MIVKLTRTDVRDLLRGLQTACSNPEVKGNAKFTYAMAKNRRLIKNEYESIQDTLNDLLTEYETKLQDMAKKYMKKDPKTSNPMYNGAGQPILDPIFKDDFNSEKEKINEEYKTQIDEKDKFLDEEIELELHLIAMSDFPEMQDYIADLLFPIRSEN